MAFVLSLEGDPASDSRPRAEVFAALGQLVLMRGAGPSWDQVRSSGPWDDPSRVSGLRCRWFHVGHVGVGPSGATRLSSTPSTRTPAKRAGAGSSDAACRHGLIGDHTVFHVVPNWRASPEIVAPSKRNCRIAQRIARTPKRARGAHTFSLRSRNVTVSQVCSRHIQRSIVPPDPCRDTGPGSIDRLHHHTTVALSKSPHNQGSQHSGHRTLCREPDHTHTERQQPDGSPPNRRADHTDHNDQATQRSSR